MSNSPIAKSPEELIFKGWLWEQVSDEEKTQILPHLLELPVNVGAVARALGLRVLASTLDLGISGEIRPDPDSEAGYTIRVNRHEVKHRQRFTVAHEIAHYLLHRGLIQNGITDNVMYRSKLPSKYEAQANRLAADMIMPRSTIGEWLQSNYKLGYGESDLPHIADAWRVSKEAAAIRLGMN